MTPRPAGAMASIAAAVLLIAAPASTTSSPAMPHPAPIVRARSVDNGACEGCHAEIAAEWRRSLHFASFTSADFQRSLTRDPDPFCMGCHAPEKDATIGVACVTCHVTSGDVLAAPTGSSTTPPEHALFRSVDFASEAACTKCHEFDFPDAKLRKAPLAMQRTVSEHHASGHAEPCASCHMTHVSTAQDAAPHVDHRFAASRDEAFVKSAVTVRARRTADDRIEVVLTPAHVGHAFPTGDVFRRVRITAGGATRFLARHYASREELPGVLVRSEVGDDRVLGRDQVVDLRVPKTPTRVQVIYERAEGASETMSSHAPVDGAIEIFRAEL